MRLGISEFVEEYEIEDELRERAPRRLRWTAWLALGTITTATILLAILAFAGFVGTRSAQLLQLATSGKTAVATVTGCSTPDGAMGACAVDPQRPVTEMYFKFATGPLPSDIVTGVTSIPLPQTDLSSPSLLQTSPSQAHAAGRFFVRYVYWGHHLLYARASGLTERNSYISIAFALALIAVAVFLYAKWLRWVIRNIRLVRHGDAVVATIVDKEIHESDIPRFYIEYGYSDRDGHDQRRRERCTPDQWRSLAIGESVTALVLRTQPAKASLYRLLPIRCAKR